MVGGPASRNFRPAMDSSSKPVICPMTSVMSGGSGLSRVRTAPANARTPATRTEKANTAGSGLIPRYRVPTSSS